MILNLLFERVRISFFNKKISLEKLNCWSLAKADDVEHQVNDAEQQANNAEWQDDEKMLLVHPIPVHHPSNISLFVIGDRINISQSLSSESEFDSDDSGFDGDWIVISKKKLANYGDKTKTEILTIRKQCKRLQHYTYRRRDRQQ